MKEEENKNLSKLLMIENVVNEMVGLREQITELKVLEIERQSAMKTLQASEKKFRTLVENIPQKMFMKDKDSVYVFCNGEYAADLKINTEDISGKTDYEFFPKELAEKYVSDDKRIMATGQLENIEEEYVHEGQTFIVHTVKTPVKDEKGETVGILGILEDITEQKRNEEELRKNWAHLEELVSNREADLKAVNDQLQREITQRGRLKQQLQEIDEMFWVLFENTGTASVMIGENLIISLANRKFEKLSGIPKEEVDGEKGLIQFLPPPGFEKIKAFYHTGRTNLATVLRDYECQFVGRGGNLADIRITAAMVPGAQKAVVSLLDISDLKRAEESLQDLQEKYQTLLENIKEAILVVQDGLLKYGNPIIFKISGYTEEELTSRPFEEFIHTEDRGIVEDHLKKLRDGESPQVYSFRIIHKDGSIRWLENRAVLIQWRKKPALLNFMKDIMDRKKVEKELRDSIEPLRALFNSLEKIFVIMNRE